MIVYITFGSFMGIQILLIWYSLVALNWDYFFLTDISLWSGIIAKIGTPDIRTVFLYFLSNIWLFGLDYFKDQIVLCSQTVLFQADIPCPLHTVKRKAGKIIMYNASS